MESKLDEQKFFQGSSLIKYDNDLADYILHLQKMNMLTFLNECTFIQTMSKYASYSIRKEFGKQMKKWFNFHLALTPQREEYLYPLLKNEPNEQFVTEKVYAFYVELKKLIFLQKPLSLSVVNQSQDQKFKSYGQKSSTLPLNSQTRKVPQFFIKSKKALNFLYSIELPKLFQKQLAAAKNSLIKHMKNGYLFKAYLPLLNMYKQYKSIKDITSFQDQNLNQIVSSYQIQGIKAKLQNFDYPYFWEKIKEKRSTNLQCSLSMKQMEEMIMKGVESLKVVFMPEKNLFGSTLEQSIFINVGISCNSLVFSHFDDLKELMICYFFITAIHQISHYLLRRIKQFQIVNYFDGSFQQENIMNAVFQFNPNPSFGTKICQILTDFYWSAYNNDTHFFQTLKNQEQQIQCQNQYQTAISKYSDLIQKINLRIQKNQQYFTQLQLFQQLSQFIKENKKNLYIQIKYYLYILSQDQNQQSVSQKSKQQRKGSFNSKQVSNNESNQKKIRFFRYFFRSKIVIQLFNSYSYDKAFISHFHQIENQLQNNKQMFNKKIIQQSQLFETIKLDEMSDFLSKIQMQINQDKNVLFQFYLRQQQFIKSMVNQLELLEGVQNYIMEFKQGQKSSSLQYFSKFYRLFKKLQIKEIHNLIKFIILTEKYQYLCSFQKNKDLIRMYTQFPEIFILGKNKRLEAGKYIQNMLFVNLVQNIYKKDVKLIQKQRSWKQIGTRPAQIKDRAVYLKVSIPNRQGEVVENMEGLNIGYCWHYYNRYVQPRFLPKGLGKH